MNPSHSSHPEPVEENEPVYIDDGSTAASGEVALPETEPTPAPQADTSQPAVRGSVAGSTWVALILGAVLLILLLVFILQNQQQVEVNLFGWTWDFPAGIAYLFSAIIGALIMALVGGWRMIELRRQVKKANAQGRR